MKTDPFSWDHRFIELARHIAVWSKDPSTKCGAVITDGKFVVSLGYNGFPQNTRDRSERFADRDHKLEAILHAEENAIFNARRPVKGFTLYCSSNPCLKCSSRIIQAGIKRVVMPDIREDPFYYRKSEEWQRSIKEANNQFDEAGVDMLLLQNKNFDVTKLMGPEHPEMIRRAEEKRAAIKMAYSRIGEGIGC